jgi:biotin operon repressor
MTTSINDKQTYGPKLKTKSGWFAAGIEFQRALSILSDGAFKLFVHLSLQADRQTGCYETTQTEVTRALNKSRRAVGKYIAELEEKGICSIIRGKNQHSRNLFQISNDYWPYVRMTRSTADPDDDGEYVAAIRDCFTRLGCTRGTFSSDDVKTARAFRQRGVSLEMVQDALFLAACRKYEAWLNENYSTPINSLRYIKPVISEIDAQPFARNYREYLKENVKKLQNVWHKRSSQILKNGRSQNMP